MTDTYSGSYDDIYEDVYGGDALVDGIPLLTVEFDAMAPQPGDFILDTSLLNSTDVLVASTRFVPVTYGVESVSITRGVTDAEAPPQAGTAQVVFDNWSGDFDPDNLNSVFNQQPGSPGLRVGMQARLSAVFPAGGTYVAQPLFVGRMESVSIDVGMYPTSTFTFVDDLAMLGQTSIPSFNDARDASADGTTGGRVAWVLNQIAGRTGAKMISPTMTRVILPTYGGDSALDEITAAVTAEAGRVFVDRAGSVTVTSHGDEYTKTPVCALSDDSSAGSVEYESIVTTNGTMRVVNAATVQRYSSPSNYEDMTGGDAASAFKYGTLSTSVVAPLASDTDAQALANYLGTRFARPIPLVEAVTVNLAGQVATNALLTTDIGEQVTVLRSIYYQNGTRVVNLRLVVIGMQWSIDSGGTFTVTLATGPVDVTSLYGSAGYFILDSSSLNGTDVLTPTRRPFVPLYVVSAGSSLPAATLNGIAAQVNIVCTSTTRPSSPSTGMVIYETDTDAFRYWTGSTWYIWGGRSQIAMASGVISINPVANVATGQAVTFPTGRFAATPAVFANAYTTYPAGGSSGGVGEVTYGGVSAAGCTIYINRSDTIATLVSWLAIDTP